MSEQSETRVRMNFAQDAKGFIKRDVTVEFPTVAEAEKAGDARRRHSARFGDGHAAERIAAIIREYGCRQ